MKKSAGVNESSAGGLFCLTTGWQSFGDRGIIRTMKSALAIFSLSVALSISCSASRSANAPAHATDTPATTPSPTAAVSSELQDKPSCTLKLSSAPVIKGLKLGMTPDEIFALFPGSKDDQQLRSEVERPPNQFGTSSVFIRPSKYRSADRFVEISQMTIRFLDGKVYDFNVGYNGPEWPHVDKFIEKLVEGTNLPDADQWQSYAGLDNQMKTLTCSEFLVRVNAAGDGGNLNYVLVQDLEADKTLKDRRRKARERASPTPQ